MGLKWLQSLASAFSGAAAEGEPVVSDNWEEARETFFKAIKKENTAMLSAVVEKYPEALKWQNDSGTCLFIAQAQGKLASFRHLVDIGAEVNSAAGEWSNLHMAIWHGRKDFVELLIERGAKIHDGGIKTATKEGHHEVADMLKRADKIRAAWLVKNPPAPPPAPPPVPSPEQDDLTTVTTSDKITVLSPLQLKQSA